MQKKFDADRLDNFQRGIIQGMKLANATTSLNSQRYTCPVECKKIEPESCTTPDACKKIKFVPAVTSSAVSAPPSQILDHHPYASLFAPDCKPLSPIMSQVFEENSVPLVPLSQQESLSDSLSLMHSDTIIHQVYANSDSSKKSEYENMPSFSQKHDFTGYNSDFFS